MTREASKLLKEHEAVQVIIAETQDPEVERAAQETKAEIEAKLAAFNIHPGPGADKPQ